MSNFLQVIFGVLALAALVGGVGWVMGNGLTLVLQSIDDGKRKDRAHRRKR